MALTKDTIKANASLATLTDEQITTIVALSNNDEAAVIGQRIGDIYRQMDTTIFEATGVKRDGDEKTYLYLERAAKELKSKYDDAAGMQKQIDNLTKEKARLEKALADGAGDAETKKALTQAQKDLAAVTKQFTDLKAQYDTAKRNHEQELFGIKIDAELNAATSGIKFKADLPKGVTDVILQQAYAKIKGMHPEYIDNGNGGKTLVYKDESGAILRNSENKLEPFTTADLLTKELKTIGVLDEGRQQRGGGTSGGHPTPPSNGIDLSGAANRNEANEIATKYLLEQGLVIGSAEFEDKMTEIWRDNNISKLPEK